QILHHRNAVPLQLLAGPNAGEQQQLRRLEAARRQDDGPARPYPLLAAAATADDSRCAAARKGDFEGAGVGGNAQVTAPARLGRQIGLGCTPAFALLLRHLIKTDPLLGQSVEVAVARQLQVLAGLEKIVVQRVGADEIGNVERAVAVVQRVPETLVALRALEVREYLGERPTAGAKRRPVVIVAAVSANVDHRVDPRRAAEHAPARLVTAPAVEARLRFGQERPVAPLSRYHERDRAGHAAEDVGIARTGLDEAHGDAAVHLFVTPSSPSQSARRLDPAPSWGVIPPPPQGSSLGFGL